MLCNGFLMNIWQIEMERSPYSNTLLFNRNTKLSLSIGLLLLFPALVQGADSLYDQQILQARQGQYAPFLSYLQQYQLRHALTPSQVADWLQVALWAGQDDEVVKVWRRYQVYMPLPARGTAAARSRCATRSSGKPRSPSGSRRSARPLAATTIVSAISKRSPMPARTARRSAKRVAWWRSRRALRTCRRSPMSTCGWAKAGTSYWWTRRSSIVIRKTKPRWPA